MSGTATSALRISSGSSARSHCSTCGKQGEGAGRLGGMNQNLQRRAAHCILPLCMLHGPAPARPAHLHALLCLQRLMCEHVSIVHVMAAEEHLRHRPRGGRPG